MTEGLAEAIIHRLAHGQTLLRKRKSPRSGAQAAPGSLRNSATFLRRSSTKEAANMEGLAQRAFAILLGERVHLRSWIGAGKPSQRN
jgi:hypothetical protein